MSGRPFDVAQDLGGILRDHHQARIGNRSFYGVLREETADGNPLGGPVFETLTRNVIDVELERNERQRTQIVIEGRTFEIDARQPDGRGVTKLLLKEL